MNTPQMIPGQVEMVSVEWIMQNATGSVDAVTHDDGSMDYLKLVQRKASDYQFPALVATIMERGFRCPIVLCIENNEVIHGNGHHRMAAALLLFLDTIPVFWSGNEDFMCLKESESEPVDWTSEELVGNLWDAESYVGPWGSWDYGW